MGLMTATQTVLEDRPNGSAWIVDGSLDSVLLVLADARRLKQKKMYLTSYGVGMEFETARKWAIRALKDGEDPAAV